MASKPAKRGKIYYFWYYQNGKKYWKSTFTEDYKEALRVKRRKEDELENRKTGKIRENALWPDYCQAYLDYSKTKKRPRSYVKDTEIISIFNKLCPIKNFREFTFQKVTEFMFKRKEMGVKESTVNRDLHTIKNMGNMAVKLKYCLVNPIEGIKKYKTEYIVKDRYLSLKEIDFVKNKVKSAGLRTLIELGLRAALRIGESYYLAWDDDIDFNNNRIYITEKEGWKPKTIHKNKQFVPLGSKLKKYLLQLKKNSTSKWVCKDYFSNEGSASVSLRKRFIEIGLRGVTSHTLRHTCLSWLAIKGVPLFRLSKFARHTDPKMIMKYAHLSPEVQSEDAEKVPY